MNKEIRAAGYIRVSSIGQTDNESLPSQRKAIRDICERRNYKLTQIYADEGISGSTVEEREDLLNALNHARQGKYNVLIVWDITRFGRNLRDTLQNYETLKESGVKLYSLKEGGDFDNPAGKLKLSTMGMIAEYESAKIKERMVGGRIAKAQIGIPTNGTLPFGRTFDKDREEWGIDQNKKKAIEWVYEEYVEKDRSLQQIALDIEPRFGFPIYYQNLVEILKEKCGTEWEINFKEHDEPIKFEIPRILSERKIQAIKDRLAHNRTNNRKDIKNKYLLTGFIRCMHCQKSLNGQRQNGGRYEYYVHPAMKSETCRKFNSVPLKEVEKSVFKMIFDDIGDMARFEEAIKDSLPDEEHIEKLKMEIDTKESRLKEVNIKRKRLLRAVLNDTLEEDELTKETSKELKETAERLRDEIADAHNHLKNLPDPEEVRKEAKRIRKELLEKYESIERLNEMTFDEKKRLLHFLFEGKTSKGKGYGDHDKYGIYIDKEGKGKNAEINYYLFGRLRALKNKDKNGSGGKDGLTRLFDVKDKSDSTGKNSYYKTNNVALTQNEPKSQGCESLTAGFVDARHNFNGPFLSEVV